MVNLEISFSQNPSPVNREENGDTLSKNFLRVGEDVVYIQMLKTLYAFGMPDIKDGRMNKGLLESGEKREICEYEGPGKV